MLSGTSRSNEPFAVIEMAELDLAMKFITYPFLERRLRGLNTIKEFIKRS
jgi:hypothetical protein